MIRAYLAFVFGLFLYACTPAEQQTVTRDESIALSDTEAACTAVEPIADVVNADAGATVTFLCTAAEGAEEASIVVTQAVIKVQASHAKAFAAKHRAADASTGG